jgi:hypothetical protein
MMESTQYSRAKHRVSNYICFPQITLSWSLCIYICTGSLYYEIISLNMHLINLKGSEGDCLEHVIGRVRRCNSDWGIGNCWLLRKDCCHLLMLPWSIFMWFQLKPGAMLSIASQGPTASMEMKLSRTHSPKRINNYNDSGYTYCRAATRCSSGTQSCYNCPSTRSNSDKPGKLDVMNRYYLVGLL